MDAELLKLVLEAGIAAFSLLVIGFLFLKMMHAHREERNEWRQGAEKQAEKVADAIRELARSINSK